MPHITLTSKSSSKPSLEFYPDGSAEVRRVAIESSPFCIGRSDSANLKIESAQVSREHVEIVERSGVWVIRDLGSTNGTIVNGKSVKETLLSDGDILTIAETDMTFVASPASQFQRMATQPTEQHERPLAPNSLPAEIAAARALTEAALWQAIPLQLFSAVSLQDEVSEAVFAGIAANTDSAQQFSIPSAVGERYRKLHRLRAIELATECVQATRLFVAVDRVETDAANELFASLDQMEDRLPAGWELGITISVPTDLDILRIGEIYRKARVHGLLIAFDGFQGNGGQVMHLESLLPDYLILSPSMIKDLTSTRQPMRRLESLCEACDEMPVKPVLPHTDCTQTLALCQQIGYDLVLQPSLNQTAAAAGACEAAV